MWSNDKSSFLPTYLPSIPTYSATNIKMNFCFHPLGIIFSLRARESRKDLQFRKGLNESKERACATQQHRCICESSASNKARYGETYNKRFWRFFFSSCALRVKYKRTIIKNAFFFSLTSERVACQTNICILRAWHFCSAMTIYLFL